MINLTIQYNLIVFSFIFGFMFSFLFDIFNKYVKKFSSFIEMFLTLLFTILMTIIYFIGIEKISNSIFHIYSIFCIIMGFCIYNFIIKIIANNNKK